MKNPIRNVLIVDDERPFLLSLTDGLRLYSRQFKVITAQSGNEAVCIIKKKRIDLMITDLRMQGMDGFELLRYVRREGHSFPIIIITAHDASEITGKLIGLGISDFMEKPLDFNHLAGRIIEILSEQIEDGQGKLSFLGFLFALVSKRGSRKKMALIR